MLSGSGGNCIEYLHKSCLKRGEATAVVGQEALVLHLPGLLLVVVGVFGHVCGLDNVHILSVVRQDSERSCFCLNLS